MFIVLQRVYDARHARRLTPSGAELTEWLEGARTGVHAADQLGGLNTRPFKDIKRFSTTCICWSATLQVHGKDEVESPGSPPKQRSGIEARGPDGWLALPRGQL